MISTYAESLTLYIDVASFNCRGEWGKLAVFRKPCISKLKTHFLHPLDADRCGIHFIILGYKLKMMGINASIKILSYVLRITTKLIIKINY